MTGATMKRLKLHFNSPSSPSPAQIPDRNPELNTFVSRPPLHHSKLPDTPPSSSSPHSKPKKNYFSRIPRAAGNPTPPISPSGSSVSNSPPKQSISTHTSQKDPVGMLRSARNAIQNFQHHQQSAAAVAVASNQQSPISRLHQTETSSPHQHHHHHHHHHHHKRQAQLPGGGFLVLTSEGPHPAICIPNSPVQQTRNTTSCLLPPMPVIAAAQQVALQSTATRPPEAPPRSTKRKPAQLTRNAVEMILQDTRVARWQRVLGYVREQRKLVISEQAEERRLSGRNESVCESLLEEGTPWARYIYSSTYAAEQLGSNMNNNAESGCLDGHVEIERRNKILDALDKDEAIAARSLWSGGSAGTNGVDEFVWDDDDEGYVGDDPMDVDPKQEAPEDQGRRYSRTQEPVQTPTQPQPQIAQATPPQLKAYTTFFRERELYEQHRQSRQSTSISNRRPNTSSSNNSRNASGSNPPPSPSSPGYKRQAIGRGIIGQRAHGKTGSFGSSSVEGAIFKMDGDRPQTSYPSAVVEETTSASPPFPSSYFRPPIGISAAASSRNRSLTNTSNGSGSRGNNGNRRATYPPVKVSASPAAAAMVTSYPYGGGPGTYGYRSPTMASMRKASVPANVVPQSPKVGSLGVAGAMDKGLREYFEGLRRFEIKLSTPPLLVPSKESGTQV